MRIFKLASLLMLIAVSVKVNGLTFKCSFKIDAEQDSSTQSIKKIICDAKIENYDEDGFKLVATNTTAVKNLWSSYKKNNNDSLLLELTGEKPIEEITEVVSVVGHNCKMHPKGLGSTFTSLKSFTLADGPLWRLRKQDLKQIPGLSDARYSNNEIEYLETDLFIYNPRVGKIDFSNNRITQISSKLGTEQSMKKWYNFNLSGNKCISRYFLFGSASNPDQAAKLKEFSTLSQDDCAEDVPGFIPDMNRKIDQISSDFQSTTKRLEADITKLGKDLQNVKTDFSQDIQAVKTGLSQDLQDVNKKLIERIEKATIESDKNFNKIYDVFEKIVNIIELAVDSLEN